MQRLVTTLALVAAAAALPAIAAATPNDKVVAKMHGVGSNQAGTVRITQGGDGSLVAFVLVSGAAGKIEPAAIDRGSCRAPGAELKPLTALTGGRSMSSVPGINYNIVRQGSYAVVVYASPFDHHVVSCGEIGHGAVRTNQSETSGYGASTTP
jgi:hypothetical protein